MSYLTNKNLNADLLDGKHAGNNAGDIPVNNGTLNTNLNADLFDNYHAGNASGNIPVNNGILNTNLNASFLDGAEKSTDGTFASNSDSKIPTEKAIALFNVPGDKGFTFNSFINKFYKGTGDTIVIPSFKVKIASKTYFTDSSVTLSVSDLDTGTAFVFGSDYYIWAGTPTSGTAPMLKISLSPSAPSGMTNPRIIGGFHYGKIRNSFTASDVSDAILSASVWDLTHMPSCYILGLMDPTTYQLGGMIEVIPGRTWADIYLASDGGGTIPNKLVYSKINVLPITGTEGLSWYDFVIRAGNVGKRLLTYAEWTKLALGSPQGLNESNLNGWTKSFNEARVKTAATVAGDADANYILGYNTSFLGARDCVGNVWEWLDEMSIRQDSTSWDWYNVLDRGEMAASQDFGQAYLPNDYGMVAWIAGGNWADGVRAGARAVVVSYCPWFVYASGGCRFACDSL